MKIFLIILTIFSSGTSEIDSNVTNLKNLEFLDQKGKIEEIEFSKNHKITRFEYKYGDGLLEKIILYQIPSSIFENQDPEDTEDHQFFLEFLNDSENPKKISEWGNEVSGKVGVDQVANKQNDLKQINNPGFKPFIIINGFYFNEDKTPSGYLKINNETISSNYFTEGDIGTIHIHIHKPENQEVNNLETESQNHNSMFFDIKTKEELDNLDQINNLAQSFPFLLKNGTNPISKDSGKLARRSFIGEDNKGNLYLGIIPYSRPSLFETGEYLEDLNQEFNLEITNVLNLDGGPSSGFMIQTPEHQETFDSWVKVPSIIVIREV